MSEQSIHELATRLEALEDERAILQTLHTYCHAIELGIEEEWLDCFTPDGALVLHWRDQPGSRSDGRSELAAFIAGHSRAPGRHHKHVYAVPLVALDGPTATVTGYVVRIDDDKGTPVIWSFGRYHDRMAKGPDGRWRIKERRLELDALHPHNPFRWQA